MTQALLPLHVALREATSFLKLYKQDDLLLPLCERAEVDIDERCEDRDIMLVQRIANEIYQAAQKWCRAFKSKNDLSSEDLTTSRLRLVLKGNYIFRNLSEIFKDTTEGNAFLEEARNKGFGDNSQEMVQFFNKQNCAIDADNPESFLKFGTRVSLIGFNLSTQPSMVRVSYLNLSCNKIKSIELRYLPQLKELYLADNLLEKVEVPETLEILDLSGNPAKVLDELTIGAQLQKLTVAYMKGIIPASFWVKSYRSNLTELVVSVVVHVGMSIKITDTRDSRQPRIVELPASSSDHKLGETKEANRRGVTRNYEGSDEEEDDLTAQLPMDSKRSSDGEDGTSGGFMKAAIGWCKIAAIVAAFGYICMKLWQRYKRA